jgi:hypothetical protein
VQGVATGRHVISLAVFGGGAPLPTRTYRCPNCGYLAGNPLTSAGPTVFEEVSVVLAVIGLLGFRLAIFDHIDAHFTEHGEDVLDLVRA